MAIGRIKTDEKQHELVEAAHVKFTGMSGSALDKPAELGDTQTFTVTARCIGTGVELRKDGERREFRKMEVVEVEFGTITPAPKDKQLQLVDDEPIGEDDGPALGTDEPDDDPVPLGQPLADPFGGR